MKSIKCFFIEPIEGIQLKLRRYTGTEKPCPASEWGHEASELMGYFGSDHVPTYTDDASEWPTKCQRCDYVFTDDDVRQHFKSALYRRQDTGAITTLNDAEAGAMYYADWMLIDGSNHNRGPDGKCLCVVTPGGIWMVDSRASNCTRPDDNEHRCWVRHGTPPYVHVDKNGNTCAAGAGSIMQGSYHGFLHHGHLKEC